VIEPDDTKATSLEEVIAVLRVGQSELAEPEAELSALSLLDHNLQCAAILRQQHPEDLELQVAGLVHDIGHTLSPDSPTRHAEIAAAYVAGVLGPRVAAVVALHIEAKRYLVATEASYRGLLSEDSIRSLAVQGESMSPEEAAAFESDTHGGDAVILRRADDGAKMPGRAVDGLEAWLAALHQVAAMAGG
jgi:predicted HD phosphohydrolase